MIRVSPSLLESYRLYLTGDWMSTEQLVQKITGSFAPTPEIYLGWAYHHMLENFGETHEMYFEYGNPQDSEILVTSDDHTFAYEPCVAPVADFLEAKCVHEVKGVKEMETEHGTVSIATKADAIWGNIGGEWKTTQKSIVLAKYMDSVQWKLCCWALGLVQMDYRIVQLFKRKDGIWDVKNSDSISMTWNDSHMDEILDLISGLVHFHQQQGLEYYLVPYYEREQRNND